MTKITQNRILRDLKAMMMKSYKIALLVLMTVVMFQACKKDDDTGGVTFELRDRQEVQDSSKINITEFLETHYYNYEDFQNPPADFNYIIQFDTISGDNADKIPLIDQVTLEPRTFDDVDYDLYVLKVREGEGEQAHFADSTFLTYRTALVGGDYIDQTPNPVWLWLTQSIYGFGHAVDNFKAATSVSKNSDGTVTASNDFGIGAVFVPAGLGYYGSTSSPYIYSDLFLTFNVYSVRTNIDTDGDGVIDLLEDVNGNEFLGDDDTDEDNIPDYGDLDDDGDGTLTIDEINIAEDGTVTYPDTDGDGTPDYLDPDNS